jgi:hypothetical protein
VLAPEKTIAALRSELGAVAEDLRTLTRGQPEV